MKQKLSLSVSSHGLHGPRQVPLSVCTWEGQQGWRNSEYTAEVREQHAGHGWLPEPDSGIRD